MLRGAILEFDFFKNDIYHLERLKFSLKLKYKNDQNIPMNLLILGILIKRIDNYIEFLHAIDSDCKSVRKNTLISVWSIIKLTACAPNVS